MRGYRERRGILKIEKRKHLDISRVRDKNKEEAILRENEEIKGI